MVGLQYGSKVQAYIEGPEADTILEVCTKYSSFSLRTIDDGRRLQKFANTIRGYIVADQDISSEFCEIALWWNSYKCARAELFDSWRLRGGICTPQHVSECFNWLDLDCGRTLLLLVARLWDEHWASQPGSACIFSLLDDTLKERLLAHSSWILYWAEEPGSKEKTILVGEPPPPPSHSSSDIPDCRLPSSS
jgi:hypothetical protein